MLRSHCCRFFAGGWIAMDGGQNSDETGKYEASIRRKRKACIAGTSLLLLGSMGYVTIAAEMCSLYRFRDLLRTLGDLLLVIRLSVGVFFLQVPQKKHPHTEEH